MRNLLLPLLAIILLAYSYSCSGPEGYEKAAATITAEELREYTMTLGSDSFMGRKPFTAGETITVNYLAEELGKIGFEPLFGDSWFQSVPMVEISTVVTGPVTIKTGNGSLTLIAPDDIAIESPSMNQVVDLKALPMVFCGFGIVAPEYGWDDYRNVDVKGKCAVVLVNDPGLILRRHLSLQGKINDVVRPVDLQI